MPVLAAVSERKARRICETAWSAVNHFREQRERLKRARTELLQKEQLGKIVKITLVCHSKHRSEPLEIDIPRADFMPCGQSEMTRFFQSCLGICTTDLKQGGLRRLCLSVNQVHDDTLMLADDPAVRLSDKSANVG